MSKNHKRAGWTGSRVTKARAYWAAQIENGVAMGVPITCGRCDQPLDGITPWDVGHITALAEGGDINRHWPEHSSCNRRDGARRTNARKRRMRGW